MGPHPVVEQVSFHIDSGEVLALVGESGCGKTVTALSILRLLPEPTARVLGGKIVFEGRDVLTLDAAGLRRVRGNRIGMIFQEPMTSLNPVFSIGAQIGEAVRLHGALARTAIIGRTRELLDRVSLPSSPEALARYPHQLSGGQRQRVMIAMALASNPRLLIADEPTTALDVTIQAQILDLLSRLRREFGMAILLITHDLGIVAEFCDRVAVMYTGRIVETASVTSLFARPRHRYTQALMRTIPAANPPGQPLPTIAGSVPAPGARPLGCAFAPRCGSAVERCRQEMPHLASGAHAFRCWNPA
jgi:oligopeptide/dipeptide ABC transporter ATP-binding protein